ncbi:MAG: hypothetical protein AAF614_03255 [Chloroflexota bacterium]
MKHHYRVVFLVVLVGLLVSFGGGKTAVAQDNHLAEESDTKWIIYTYVDQGQLRVDWQVVVYELLQGNWLITQSTTELQCAVDHGIQILDQHIAFDGSGGIHCQVPSFAEEVYDLSEGEISLPAYISATGVYAIANVAIPDSLNSAQLLPVFKSSNLTYDIDVVAPNLHLAEQRLGFNISHETVSQFTYPVNAVANAGNVATYLSIYQTRGYFKHWQDGNLLFQEQSNNVWLSTGPDIICIGCNDNGDFFVGELWYGEFDPGCQKFCSG